MAGRDLRTKVLSGLFWRLGELITSHGVSFVVSLILARLIAPNEYGVIALLMVFIEIANVFVVDGFGSALVQKKDADELDFSSCFYCNIIFSLILYIALFVSADGIARFYENDAISTLLKVLSLKIIVSSVNSIQHAYVQRQMIFKRFFYSTLIGTILSAVVGIVLALNGYGAWALVVQYLTNSIIDTIVLFFTVKWRPKLIISFDRIKVLYSFGWKILCSSLLHSVYVNLRSFVIGKVYTPSDLAFYNQGERLPKMVSVNINAAISSVLFPALAKAQDDVGQMKSMIRRAIKTSAYICWPLLMVLASVSVPVVTVLFSSVWLPCVPFLIIACVNCAFEPVQMANIQAIKALGRSDLTLTLEVIKKAYGVVIILITMPFGVLPIALGALSQSFVALLINTFPNRKLLRYSYRELASDLFYPIVFSLFTIICVFVVSFAVNGFRPIIQLLILVPLGFLIYSVCVYIFKREEYEYFLSLIKSVLK